MMIDRIRKSAALLGMICLIPWQVIPAAADVIMLEESEDEERVFAAGIIKDGKSEDSTSEETKSEEGIGETESLIDEEPDWAAYAPDLTDEDGNFVLDLDYINAYETQVCTDMIFFGDSRVVGMAYGVGTSHYIGKVAAGYSWMSGEGAGLLAEQMEKWPQADIVFCFGVNDLGNIDSYISYYQGMLDRYPKRRFWFLSVDPVNESVAGANGYTVSNQSIESFNARLEEAFPDRYIDCYDYLMGTGFSASDGVHYGNDAYFAVEDFCWREIQKKLEEQ